MALIDFFYLITSKAKIMQNFSTERFCKQYIFAKWNTNMDI